MEEFTTYKKIFFYWIGWKWGYAIMPIIDNYGEEKLRLIKCKIYEGFPETTMYEWEEVPVDYINYLNQSNRINFKRKDKDNLEEIFEMLTIELNKLKSQ